MPNFFFCTNADCKKLLTDFELNRLTYNKSGTVKGSRYKFCKQCRHDAHLVDRIRCVGCRDIFNPVTVTDKGHSSGSIYKVFCNDCSHRNNKRRSLTQYHELAKNPEFIEKRNKKSKLRRLQKQGRLPADLEIVA